MFVSKIKVEYITPRKARFCQGDILKDVHVIHGIYLGGTRQKAEKEYLPYCVVMSQDCDLQSDIIERKKATSQDKYLKSILLCPAYQADLFFEGKHIDGWQMQADGRVKKYLDSNNDFFPRYHYLQGEPDLKIPNLVIDFKHFFTVPRDMAYENKKNIYLATINELYRELLSQRFASFLSRIGKPD